MIKGTGTRSPGSTLFLIYPLLRFIASNKEGRAFSGAEGFLNMDFKHIYTDGSKSSSGVGAAVIFENKTSLATLPCQASIFSAEAYALKMAIRLITNEPGTRFVIFSDSLSVAKSMLNSRSTNPTIRYLIHEIDRIQSFDEKLIEICWIPSHIGIPGNTKADEKALLATRRTEELITIHYKDLFHENGLQDVPET